MTRVVSDDCPRIPPTIDDSTVISNKCWLLVLFIVNCFPSYSIEMYAEN